MKVTYKRYDGSLTIFLSGELDHHAARIAVPETSKLIDSELPTSTTLDFENISFMDSSGIALVIGAFKRAKLIGSTFNVINVPKHAYKVFNAAGICKIIPIKECEKILL